MSQGIDHLQNLKPHYRLRVICIATRNGSQVRFSDLQLGSPLFFDDEDAGALRPGHLVGLAIVGRDLHFRVQTTSNNVRTVNPTTVYFPGAKRLD